MNIIELDEALQPHVNDIIREMELRVSSGIILQTLNKEVFFPFLDMKIKEGIEDWKKEKVTMIDFFSNIVNLIYIEYKCGRISNTIREQLHELLAGSPASDIHPDLFSQIFKTY